MADNDNRLDMRVEITDEVTKAAKTIQRALDGIKSPKPTGFQRELERVKDTIKEIGKQIKEVTIPALELLGFSTAGVSVSLYEISRRLREFSDDIADLKFSAQEVGLSIKEYRGFIDAANSVRIAPEQAAEAMRTFRRNAEDFYKHTGAARDELYRLGAGDVVDAIEKTRDPIDKMNIAFERMQFLQKTNPARAREFAQIMFGNARVAMLSMDEVRKYMREALGLTNDEIERAIKFRELWSTASRKFDELKQKIGSAVLPGMTQLVDATRKVIEDNPEAIQKLAEGFGHLADSVSQLKPEEIEAFVKGVGYIARDVGTAVKEVAQGISDILNMVELIQRNASRNQPLLQGDRAVTFRPGVFQRTRSSQLNLSPGADPSTFARDPDSFWAQSGAALSGRRDQFFGESFKQYEELKNFGGSLSRGLVGGTKNVTKTLHDLNTQLDKYTQWLKDKFFGGGPSFQKMSLGGFGGVNAGRVGFGSSEFPLMEQSNAASNPMGAVRGMGGAGGITAPAGTPIVRSGLATVKSATGRTFKVDARFASNFQGFINDYEAAGGVIGPDSGTLGMRGNPSGHPIGDAIDINQIGRNIRSRAGRTLPIDIENKIAEKWGMVSGANFSNPDAGHFGIRSQEAAAAAMARNIDASNANSVWGGKSGKASLDVVIEAINRNDQSSVPRAGVPLWLQNSQSYMGKLSVSAER